MDINSIRGKKLELLAFLDFYQPHIVVIQETKNDSSIATSELFPESCPYNVYRKDRNLHGGGVMLLVHKDISHTPIMELELQIKLLIMWQVGTGNLVVLVKIFSCSEISLTISGTNTKVKNSPRFTF